MGKSYSEKIKAKNEKGSETPRPEKRSKREQDKKERFPIAPLVVIIIVLILIISTVVLYRIQNDGGDGSDPNGGSDDDGDNNDNILPFHTINIESVNNGIITLQQYKGKVVLLDMFATWCEPCRQQMIQLIDIQSRYSRSDVVILSVDMDLTETLSQVRDFKDEFPEAQWTFARSNLDFNMYFPASSIPTLYLLDRNGNMAGTHVGLTSADDLAREINEHI